MSDSNYWNDKYWPRVMTRRLSRRRLIQIGGMGAAGAMAAAYLGCGGDEQATGDAPPSLAEFVSPTATVYWRRWFGPASAPGKVQWDGKLATLGATAPNKTTTELTGLGANLEGSVWANDVKRAYFAGFQTPYILVRFDPANNSYSTYTEAGGHYGNVYDLCVTGGKVYVACQNLTVDSKSAFIQVFNTADDPPVCIATYRYVVGGSYNARPESIATDGTYFFVGTGGWGNILLIKIDDGGTPMVLKDTLNVSATEGVHALEYCPLDGMIYASIEAHSICKVSYADGHLHLEAEVLTDGSLTSDDICFDDSGYVWIPREVAGGAVFRISRSTFSSIETLYLGPSAYECNGLFADSDGTHIWALWKPGYPAQLTRIRTADLVTDRIWLADAEHDPNELVQYGAGKYLVQLNEDPQKIVNLTNPFPDTALQKPASGSNYSYWAAIRPFLETTTERTVGSVGVYTDGANGLGTGWTAVGGVASQYEQATGTDGVTGTVLNTTNYTTLEATPVDIFGWTSASPKAVDGTLANPDIGDVGVAGTDECFLVLQLVAAPTVAPGPSNQETLTITHLDGSAPMSKTASIRGEASIPAVAG